MNANPIALFVFPLLAAVFLPGQARAESPKLYFSLNSLYGMASDRNHIRDIGLAWENPVWGGFTAVARARYLWVKQELWDDEGDQRQDNIYANSFPSTYRMVGLQAALRRHPWEWMPGFFTEALMGYKHVTSENTEPTPGWSMNSYSAGPRVSSFSNHALEAAIGFGYLWELKRMRIALGFAFGPEFLFRNSLYENGKRQSSGEVLDLLRFNQLEAGFAF